MRLLILTTQDKFFVSHIIERANYFKRQGWDVGVAVQITDKKLAEQITSAGFRLYDTQIERKSINPFSQLSAIFRLIKIYFNFKPSMAWHLGAKSILYGTIVSLLLRHKQSIGIINAPIGLGYVYASNDIKARFLRPILEVLYKFLLFLPKSKVIIENFDDINYFVKIGALRSQDAFCILGAGVDTNLFLPGQNKGNICTVVMASRLIREKGVLDFVKVAEMLKGHNIEVEMVLVGEPDYGNPSSISKTEFENLKKNTAIRCLGYRSNINQVLKTADVFCLPSFYREGLPRALVEATSCGLVILTTDTIGCREAVRNNNGFLFKPHDTKQLFLLIKYLVDHPDERREMGKRSRKVALDYFDSQKIAKRTFEVFNSLKSCD